MAHIHSVYDTDNHFSINPITRAISDISNSKTLLMQYDHNSERFTFEMPRHIEGHDMMECTDVHIHYLNVSSNRQDQSAGVYAVDDLQISPSDENMVICSWLISQNATRLVGTLNFLLRFVCRTDDEVDYVWNTAIYSGIKVADGIYNGNDIDDDYSYATAELEERVAALEAENNIQAPDTAKVGQFLAVKTVDGEGKPVTWEAKNVQVDGSSIELDTTLTVAGKAADAKAVGEALSQVQGGGSVEVDKTLTEEGKAADAKAVGDALAKMRGIESVVQTDSGTQVVDGTKTAEWAEYTITYTDGTTFKYRVYDGADGADGVDGEGISQIYKMSGTGEAGTTDTYGIQVGAVVYPFTVYNGANGTDGKSASTSGIKAALELMRNLLAKAVYTENVSSMLSELDTLLESIDTDDSGTTTTKTLTGITAVYSGGSVPVGTAVTALTGVTVKATYSDGSTGNVTGYTLSGTINEGSNTITVSYGGKTTSFTVTGVEESSGDEENSGDGHVVITDSGVAATDDGDGNVTVTGMTATDDGNGNITVS